mgnify:FL=1
MKKLILSAAFVMAFATTALAQTDNKVQTTSPAAQPATTTTVTTPATQDPAAMPGTATTTATPVATAATPATATAQQQPATDGKEYNKVTQNQIAPAVLKKAVAKYKDYALSLIHI